MFPQTPEPRPVPWLKLTVAALVIATATVIGAFYWWASAMAGLPRVHEKEDVYIDIPKGSTKNEIFEILDREGIINGTWPIWNYTRLEGDSLKLQAGSYKFPSPISAVEAIELLKKGQNRTVRITVPEGFTRFDIAKRLAANLPVNPPMDEVAVLALMNDTSLIRDFDPDAENLEGYIYPATYDFNVGTTPQEAIDRMVGQFKKIWKPEWDARARELGRTSHEIITIASLIETESKFDAERVIVSSVIYNRLRMGMALGIDQTAVYIAKMEGRWDGTIHKSDLASTSPYNTRKFAGLPPGPISSVSESAIYAALNPSTTNYIFYVLDVEKNDGSHKFYASAAEFEKGKAAYQRWLATQR
jgi:UPF0755 protein